jgi:hypothetical protein
MVKWRFWQKDQPVETTELPAEVQEYYESTQRETRSKAWLLAAGTLVVTLIVATGLFFGGRFVYQRFANNDEAPTTGLSDQPAKPAQPAQPNPPTTNDADEGSSTTRSAQDDSSDTQNETSTDPDETPVTRSGDITDSGPGDVLAIFVFATVVGTLAYEIVPHLKSK